jgi:hypothetical protein
MWRGEVEDESNVAALSSERRAAATAKNRRAKLPRQQNSGDAIVGIVRGHNSDGNLAEVGAVGRVERTATGIESYFSAKSFFQGGFESRSIAYGRFGSFRDFDERVRHGSNRLAQIANHGWQEI